MVQIVVKCLFGAVFNVLRDVRLKGLHSNKLAEIWKIKITLDKVYIYQLIIILEE